MAVDADTKKFLEEVKKGKPRRFAMIMKGETIVSLIVYKKGTVEKYKKQAKEEGQGQFYFGVVDGKGQNISFKLSTQDGFDDVPGKDVKLKTYLNDEAGMKFKPVYAVVTSLPQVDDADEADQVPTAPPPPEATAATQSPPPPPPPAATADIPPQAPVSTATVDSATFLNRLKGLMPDLKTAQASETPLAKQVAKLLTLVQTLGKEKRYSDGMKVLDKLEELIRQANSSPPKAPPVPPSAEDPTVFLKRLKSLAPELKQALAAKSSFGDQLNDLSGKVQLLGKNKKFAEGMTVLQSLEKLIPQALAEGKAAAEAAEAAAGANAAVPGNPLEMWRDVKEQVDSQISSLQSALLGFNDPDLERIAEYGMHGITDGLQVKLQAAIFDLNVASEVAAKDKAKAKAIQIITAYEKIVAGSEVITLCDENPFGIKVNIRKTLQPGLQRIRHSIQAA